MRLPAEGPVAGHPDEPRIVWAEGTTVWEWSLLSEPRRVLTAPRVVTDLCWTRDGRLWVLDTMTLSVDGVPVGPGGDRLTEEAGTVVSWQTGWEDGTGPVTRSSAGEVRPGEDVPERPRFVGTPDGRFLVGTRGGQRGIWELPAGR